MSHRMVVAMDDERLTAVLLGTAVGDALGLPFEGMSRRRVRRFLSRYPLGRGFRLARSAVSDDTDHACLVARALLSSRGEPESFARELGRGLRWWLLSLPAGIGWATLRGIVRLWLGYAPAKSGVRSAGNGPAMRAAPIGVLFSEDEPRLRALVRASTLLTHSDPRAFDGALAVALTAGAASRGRDHGPSPRVVLEQVAARLDDGEMADLVRRAAAHWPAGAEIFADELGLADGVSGFVNHTVPLALLCWARHPRNAEAALGEVIALGGDTDTTAAIVGALCAASAGKSCLPAAWLPEAEAWPRSVSWLRVFSLLMRRALTPY
jgi:ADP-ribosylglycohydrolase